MKTLPLKKKYYFSYDKNDKENTLLWYGEEESNKTRFALQQPTNINYLINKIYNNIDKPFTIVFDSKLYTELPSYNFKPTDNLSFLSPCQNDIIDFSNISAENAAYQQIILQLNDSMLLCSHDFAYIYPMELYFPKKVNNSWDFSKTALENVEIIGNDESTGDPIFRDNAKAFLNSSIFFIRTDKFKEFSFMIVEYDVEVLSNCRIFDSSSNLYNISMNLGVNYISAGVQGLSKNHYFYLLKDQYNIENPIFWIMAFDKDSVSHLPTKIKFSNTHE